jgi:copper(I)-binding protein
MKKILAVALGAFVLHVTAALGDGAMSVADPYARAVPPGQVTSAVFLRLDNAGDAPQSLVGGKAEVAEAVELHEHTMEGGMMRMRRVEAIEVPAQGSVTLEPGGLHIMLIGLKRDLNPGDRVDLSLELGDGSVLQVEAPVREVQPMGHASH